MEKAKKILIFSLVYYPRNIGGAEVAIKEITDRISSSEIQFDMITLAKHEPSFEKVGNINVYRVGSVWLNKTKKFGKLYKYFFIFFAFFKAVKLNRKNHYDLVWSMMANYAGFSALFFKLLKPKIPFLLTLQEGDPIDYIKKRVGFLYPIFKMIFKKADSIQAISNYLADFGKSMGFGGEPVVIPNGVDVKNFDSELNSGERKNTRVALELKKEDVALVTTSRLVIKNGVGDVIKALKFLSENIKFIIVGSGELEDKLKLETRNSKLETQVHFLGFVSHDNMPKYLKACDIFIRPSLSEGQGVSFMEAMACKLPVIATPVGGIVDFVFDSEKEEDKKNNTGYFCEPQNPQSIADTIKKVISDPSKNQIIENAHQMVLEKYDWDKIALQMNDVFVSIDIRSK